MKSILSFPSWVWPLLLLASLAASAAGIYISIVRVQSFVVQVLSQEQPVPIFSPEFNITQFSQAAPYIDCTVVDSDVSCR